MNLQEFNSEWHNNLPYIVAHTSGSTGVPKSIRLLKSDMEASACATNSFFNLSSDAVFACPLDFGYIAAKMMAVRAEIAHGTFIEMPPSNSFNVSKHVDLLAVVPTQAKCLLKNRQWASAVSNIIIGGAQLLPNDAQELLNSGYKCWQTYGMTETCSHVALKPLDAYLYTALPGISFSIDSRNCLVINAQQLSQRTFITNDIANLHSPTQFEWIGRYDNVINSGGIKIHPEVLEAQIRKALNPDFDFYITGRPHAQWGEAVTMVAETTDNILVEVKNALRKVLPHKHLPKQYITVDTLPRTNNGKIKRV